MSSVPPVPQPSPRPEPTPPPPPPPPPPAARAGRNEFQRLLLAARRNPATAATALVAVALVVVLAGLSLWNYENARDWQQRALAAESVLGTSEEELADVAAERDDALGELRQVRGERDRLSTEVGDLRDAAVDVEARAAELAELEATLAEREEAVTATEEQVAANSVGSGTWTVGVDMEPGTYRTKEAVSSSLCYWGIYVTGTNLDDIVQNDIVEGGFPTVNLSEGQDFKSSDCGVWVRQ